MQMKPTEVWKDFHNHTYLKVAEGRKLSYFAAMDSSNIRVIGMDTAMMRSRGMTQIEYPLGRAINLFREAARDFGATAKAKKALKVRPRANPKMKFLKA